MKGLRRPGRLVWTAIIVTVVVGATACGSSSSGGSSGGGGSAPAASSAPKISVGLVTDIGGLNDRWFNQLANEGLEQAGTDLGVQPAS